ncbi:hypothetical protein BKA80DRAFT_332754 [Phyllosticta citrichinensis]
MLTKQISFLTRIDNDYVAGLKEDLGFNGNELVQGLVILVIWNVPESAKWFAFSTAYASPAMSSVFHGWVNTQLRSSPAERSFTLVLINAIAQSSTAWIPLLVLPTVEAPRYPKGYAFCLGSAILLIISTHLLRLYVKRTESALPVSPQAVFLLTDCSSVPKLRIRPDLSPKASTKTKPVLIDISGPR